MIKPELPPLTIRSGQGDYQVFFEQELDKAVARIKDVRNGVVLVDRRIAELYREPLAPLLQAMPALLMDATEESKTLAGVSRVATWLQENKCTKQTTLIAVGGGIMQDLATFTSHVYYRGIKWVFLPTTLLSMSDSCIGAKCGINLNAFKNQLSVFQSPSKVVIFPGFLRTLSDTDVSSGYGEILKLMLTGSKEDFDDLRRVVSAEGLRTPQLARLILRSLEIKKQVIEADEYESDLRRILNYGHTFGHSLEALCGYEVPHGLGVAWGLDLVNFIAARRGFLAQAEFEDAHRFILEHLPFKRSRPVSAADLIDGTRRDKKVQDGQLTLILMERPGRLKIVKTPFDDQLTSEVGEYLAKHDAFHRG